MTTVSGPPDRGLILLRCRSCYAEWGVAGQREKDGEWIPDYPPSCRRCGYDKPEQLDFDNAEGQ